jgi:hypothetical protein
MYKGAIDVPEFAALLKRLSFEVSEDKLVTEVTDLLRRVNLGMNQSAIETVGKRLAEEAPSLLTWDSAKQQFQHEPPVNQGGNTSHPKDDLAPGFSISGRPGIDDPARERLPFDNGPVGQNF